MKVGFLPIFGKQDSSNAKKRTWHFDILSLIHKCISDRCSSGDYCGDGGAAEYSEWWFFHLLLLEGQWAILPGAVDVKLSPELDLPYWLLVLVEQWVPVWFFHLVVLLKLIPSLEAERVMLNGSSIHKSWRLHRSLSSHFPLAQQLDCDLLTEGLFPLDVNRELFIEYFRFAFTDILPFDFHARFFKRAFDTGINDV